MTKYDLLKFTNKHNLKESFEEYEQLKELQLLKLIFFLFEVFIYLCFFLFYLNNKKQTQETELSHPLVHSSGASNCQSWALMKLRKSLPRNPVGVGRTVVLEPSSAVSRLSIGRNLE